MKLRLRYALLIAAAAAFTPVLQAAHYPPGIEGLKAASLPPPGVYLRDYNVFYFANQVNDTRGNKISGLDPELFVYANVPRLLWITKAEVLGGNIGFDALVPLQYTDFEAGGFSKDRFGVGDVFGEVTWSKHIEQFDFAFGYGVWAPTGNSSPDDPTEAGMGYWTHMLTAGLTWYPDKAKQWSVSLLNRYEINTEKDSTDLTPGQVWTLEGGIGRVVCKNVELGVIGYYQNQMSKDTGSDAGDGRDRVAGIGPEVNMFCSKLGVSTSLRYAYEFLAENRPQGHTVTLTLTKRF